MTHHITQSQASTEVRRQERCNAAAWIVLAALLVMFFLMAALIVVTTVQAIDLSAFAVPQHYDCPTRRC